MTDEDKIIDAEFVETPKPRTLTETEALAVELVNVPQAMVAELLGRLNKRFPRHERVLAREPATSASEGAAERVARYLFDFERGAPLARNAPNAERPTPRRARGDGPRK
jgi:hypothetical protein